MTHDHSPSIHCKTVFRWGRGLAVVWLAGATFAAVSATARTLSATPINYSAAKARNAITRLQERIDAGTAKLEFEPTHGYLRSLLRLLEVPESSQVLVFSKTSMQRERISPRTPRAIYYNDEVMVGFCRRGQVIEVSAADEAIGTAFYTLEQARDVKAVPQRQTDSCLLCHSSSSNQGYPGHLVRSLFVDTDGNPLLASGSFRTDHDSPLAERWGGWYVTGTSGRQKHMGNMICEGASRPDEMDNTAGVNVVDLHDRLKTSYYLTPHSDIVALMVLEHQTGMLNRLARAGMDARMALTMSARSTRRSTAQPTSGPTAPGPELEASASRSSSTCFSAMRLHLTDEIKGTSSFASDFANRGPRNSKGGPSAISTSTPGSSATLAAT